ncbi:TonB-dependent receptor [Sphingomonas sp. PB4P5]|uniref:TonB-dependent receptor n=1 Tax=Parasphingomonas puruogangriensis TaxID=3096155 RepID=UPI002FC98F02
MPINVPHSRPTLVLAALFAACPVAPVLAQEAAPPAPVEATESEEITVTAQSRAQSIVETPLAITAISQSAIVHRKLDDIKDLITYTPGFSGNSDDSFIDQLAVRGIVSNDYGIGGDPSVGVFKDGVYQGRTGSVVTSLYDVERAEALRGPQGFLFGRNAISGAISVVTNKPKLGAFGGHVYLGYGQSDRKEAEIAVNLPLGEHWALRVAGYHTDSDGWVDNAFTQETNDRLMAENKWAGRGSLLYDNGPLRIVVTGEYERRRQDGTPYRASNDDREVLDTLEQALDTEIVVRGGPDDVDTDLVNPRDDGSILSVNMQADLDLGFATVTSISAHRSHKFFYSEDYDGTSLLLGNYTQNQNGSYASQELRLVSPGGRPLTWSFGLSGYREKVRAQFTNEASESAVCLAGYGYAGCEELTQDLYGIAYLTAPGGILVDINHARTVNTGLSAYADANYRPLPKLQLGVGLRYTWDRKKFALNVLPSDSTLGNIWTFTYYTNGFVERARSWQGLTPRFFVRYEPRPDLSIYASVTRGYKAGGFGSFTVNAPSPVEDYGQVPAGTQPDAFEPETVWSKEVGIKGAVLDRMLQFDVTGFHYVYSDLQTVFFDTASRTQRVINVGRVHGYGVEAQATLRPSRYFDVNGNIAYTRTVKRGDRDCTLRDCGGLPNPTWASSGTATFRYPVGEDEAYLSGEWSYQGKARQAYDWRGITRRQGSTTANVRFGYRSMGGWEANLYVENVFDSLYYRGAENNGDLTPANVWGVAQPRNAGLNIRWIFGQAP